MNMKEIKSLLKNDQAKARVKRLNQQGKAAVAGATDGDEKLAAYKAYVDKFYELKEKYPNWEERLDTPIEYSRFVLDYNEPVYRVLLESTESFRGLTPPQVYALKMHGINMESINILQQKLGEMMPGSKWTDPQYFDTHIREAYQELRQLFPNDEEYDNIFSPKEEMLFWSE